MTFNVALSGIRAANIDLEVTGNNIANASTIGFKESRAEFGDIYANSLFGSGSFEVGDGVRVTEISQSFDQGNLLYTENELDLAISGEGFFILSVAGEPQYTRDGTFTLDQDGRIISNNGGVVQGYDADEDGNIVGVLSELQINADNIPPRQTFGVDWELNLDSSDDIPLTAVFDPTDASSYNSATSVTVYDGLGVNHTLTQYFVQTPSAGNTTDWLVYSFIDGQPTDTGGGVSIPNTMTFDSSGQLIAVDGVAGATEVSILDWAPDNAEDPLTPDITVDYRGTTQFGSEFGVTDVSQNGYATGRLSGLEISQSGTIFARFTNGQSQVIGQVALASFNSNQGLEPVGDNSWAETFASGEPNVGAPGTASLGLINSGALEESNTDLTEQLVQLIIAQRNFQANSKTIETADQTTQTIINIR
ncbi:flagellar hook protein FlgE [Marinibactrum halimedae]|uniref:Flagellar hook protein FlgE n=1 Tax=Marinibactrum halimedae TaxID=1444977 RepID=A0AA37WM02_9GAMM|nr:flagellar hook protein FlgE [Marinibactrum halimedae]MCD9458391.1 flagellar hook protein FlgE [Marinibactrum halimedae]GLS26088.1 flagellar hook protein FlgE [Marinibactrum halimedae]